MQNFSPVPFMVFELQGLKLKKKNNNNNKNNKKQKRTSLNISLVKKKLRIVRCVIKSTGDKTGMAMKCIGG